MSGKNSTWQHEVTPSGVATRLHVVATVHGSSSKAHVGLVWHGQRAPGATAACTHGSQVAPKTMLFWVFDGWKKSSLVPPLPACKIKPRPLPASSRAHATCFTNSLTYICAYL